MTQIHEAGPMVAGVQVCRRCGEVLADYRGAMVPEEDAHKALRGWTEGAAIEVSEGNPRYSGVTLEEPTCLRATGGPDPSV